MVGHICMSCEHGADMQRFDDETFTIEHAEMRAAVNGLSGWRCEACGEVEFAPESARRYAKTSDDLLHRARAATPRNQAHSAQQPP